MQTIIGRINFTLWPSYNETWDWSTSSNAFWPNLTVVGKHIVAHFASNRSVEYSVDSRTDVDVDNTEAGIEVDRYRPHARSTAGRIPGSIRRQGTLRPMTRARVRTLPTLASDLPPSGDVPLDGEKP